MTTIQELATKIFFEPVVYVKTQPEDSLHTFGRGVTEDDIVKSFPEKYRADLIGFEQHSTRTYYPKFATMQDEWYRETNDYIDKKHGWCAKHTSD